MRSKLHCQRSLKKCKEKPRTELLPPPQLFRAELGESLVLPCRVANLGEFVLMWKRNSRVLTAGNLVVRKDSRISIAGGGPHDRGGGGGHGLEIADLRADDGGTYTCEVDVMGRPIHISHTVGEGETGSAGPGGELWLF